MKRGAKKEKSMSACLKRVMRLRAGVSEAGGETESGREEGRGRESEAMMHTREES